MACRKVKVHFLKTRGRQKFVVLFSRGALLVVFGGSTCQGHATNGLLRWIPWQQFGVIRPSSSFGLVAQYQNKMPSQLLLDLYSGLQAPLLFTLLNPGVLNLEVAPPQPPPQFLIVSLLKRLCHASPMSSCRTRRTTS